MNPNYKYLLIGIILILISGLGGYSLAQKTQTKSLNYNPVPVNKATVPNPTANTFFDHQQAFVTGIITQFKDNKITVTNDHNQTTRVLPLSPKIIIYSPAKENGRYSSSTNPQSIDINKRASVVVELQNEVYQVISITYAVQPSTSSK